MKRLLMILALMLASAVVGAGGMVWYLNKSYACFPLGNVTTIPGGIIIGERFPGDLWSWKNLIPRFSWPSWLHWPDLSGFSLALPEIDWAALGRTALLGLLWLALMIIIGLILITIILWLMDIAVAFVERKNRKKKYLAWWEQVDWHYLRTHRPDMHIFRRRRKNYGERQSANPPLREYAGEREQHTDNRPPNVISLADRAGTSGFSPASDNCYAGSRHVVDPQPSAYGSGSSTRDRDTSYGGGSYGSSYGHVKHCATCTCYSR